MPSTQASLLGWKSGGVLAMGSQTLDLYVHAFLYCGAHQDRPPAIDVKTSFTTAKSFST